MLTERKGTKNKDWYRSCRQHVAYAYLLPNAQLHSNCRHAKTRGKHSSDGIQWPRNQMLEINPFSGSLKQQWIPLCQILCGRDEWAINYWIANMWSNEINHNALWLHHGFTSWYHNNWRAWKKHPNPFGSLNNFKEPAQQCIKTGLEPFINLL